MSIKRESIRLSDERVCESITLQTTKGAYVEILTLGGIIKSIYVPNREGVLENVVLEYTDINTYIENPGYINALIGRTAGRIHKGQVTIEDTIYQLNKNEGNNTLHGGYVGIDKKIWDVVAVNEEVSSVTLSCICADGEEGYPGTLTIRVTYTFTEEQALTIHYEAQADQDTIVNLTNHAYFNLSGNSKRLIEDHVLRIQADAICELDGESIPTGVLLPVKEHTYFDFNTAKRIGQDIDKEHAQLQQARGYDHPWVISGEGNVVEMYDEIAGRKMMMTTDQKVVVVYAMNYENPSCFTNGLENIRRYGICFETQNLPVGHNEVFKEGSILPKGKCYTQTTTYKFESI